MPVVSGEAARIRISTLCSQQRRCRYVPICYLCTAVLVYGMDVPDIELKVLTRGRCYQREDQVSNLALMLLGLSGASWQYTVARNLM